MDQLPKHPSPASGASEASSFSSSQDQQAAPTDSVAENHDVPVVDLSLVPDTPVDDFGITVDYETAVARPSPTQEPTNSSEIQQCIDELLASGKIKEAARLSLITGRYQRAISLYEQAGDFQEAAMIAEQRRMLSRTIALRRKFEETFSDEDVQRQLDKHGFNGIFREEYREITNLRDKSLFEHGEWRAQPDKPLDGDIDAVCTLFLTQHSGFDYEREYAGEVAELAGRPEKAISCYAMAASTSDSPHAAQSAAVRLAKAAGLEQYAINALTSFQQLDAAASLAKDIGDIDLALRLLDADGFRSEGAKMAEEAGMIDEAIKFHVQDGRQNLASRVAEKNGRMDQALELWEQRIEQADPTVINQPSTWRRAADLAEKAELYLSAITYRERAAQVREQKGDTEGADYERRTIRGLQQGLKNRVEEEGRRKVEELQQEGNPIGAGRVAELYGLETWAWSIYKQEQAYDHAALLAAKNGMTMEEINYNEKAGWLYLAAIRAQEAGFEDRAQELFRKALEQDKIPVDETEAQPMRSEQVPRDESLSAGHDTQTEDAPASAASPIKYLPPTMVNDLIRYGFIRHEVTYENPSAVPAEQAIDSVPESQSAPAEQTVSPLTPTPAQTTVQAPEQELREVVQEQQGRQPLESSVDNIIMQYVAREEHSKAAEVADLTERYQQASVLHEQAGEYGLASLSAHRAGLIRRAAELAERYINDSIEKGYSVTTYEEKRRDDLVKESKETGDHPIPDNTEDNIDARIVAYETAGRSFSAAGLAGLTGRTEYAINFHLAKKEYWNAARIAEEAELLERAISLYQMDATADEQKGSSNAGARYKIEELEQRIREQKAHPHESDTPLDSARPVDSPDKPAAHIAIDRGPTFGVSRPHEEREAEQYHQGEQQQSSAVVPVPDAPVVAPTQVNVTQVVVVNQGDKPAQPTGGIDNVISVGADQPPRQGLSPTSLRELEQKGSYGQAAYLADYQGQTGRAAELARKQQYLLEQKGNRASADYWRTYAVGLEKKLGIHPTETSAEGSADDTVSTPTLDEALYTAGEGTSTADVTAPPSGHRAAQPPAGEYQPASPAAPRPKAPKRKQRAGQHKPAQDTPRQQRQRVKREPSPDSSADSTPADAPDKVYSNPLTEAVARLRQQQTAFTAHADELYARVREIESRGYQQRRDGVSVLVGRERTAASAIPQLLQDIQTLYRAAAEQIPGLDQRLAENLADVDARIAFAADAHATALREQAGLPHINLFMYERAYRRFGMGISNFTSFLDTVEKYARQQPTAHE